MIKCKQATDVECGKDCCCIECSEKDKCKNVCEFVRDGKSDGCEDAYSDETALATMKEEAAEVIEQIAALSVQKKEIEDQEKKMRVALMEAMEKYGVKSFENEKVKFVYVAPTTRTSIDTKNLKKDLPNIAAKYSKTSNVSASVKITVK